MENIEITVQCEVTNEKGLVAGRETFSMVIPATEHNGEFDLQSAINTISESQNLAADIARQTALSATWKAARHFNERIPKPDVPELEPPV